METDIDARKIALHPYLGKYSGQAGRPGPQARLKLFQVTNIVVRGYDDTAPLKKVVVAGTCASFPSVRAWFTTCARSTNFPGELTRSNIVPRTDLHFSSRATSSFP